MKNNIYNQVCSLGPFCHTGNLLQRLEIKIVSFPFDWCCTDPLIISDCVQNNFKYFLDRRYFVFEETEDHQQNKYYIDNFNLKKNIFAHDNPLKIETYEYYERCIKRFNILLNCSDKKLFIISYMVTYTEIVDDDYIKKIQKLNDTLSSHTTNYDILCIINNPKQSFQSAKYSKIDKNIILLELNTLSISHGVFFLNDTDNSFLKYVINNNFSFDIKDIYQEIKKN